MLDMLLNQQVKKATQGSGFAKGKNGNNTEGTGQQEGATLNQMSKKEKEELVKKMKDEVPTVLLNQWLDIQPEKSAFTKPECCIDNADEYSVYSDDTVSKALSVTQKTLTKKASSFAKRGSVLQNPSQQKITRDTLNDEKERRNTVILRQDTIAKKLSAISNHQHPTIVEVEDFSDASSDSHDLDRNEFVENAKAESSTGDDSNSKSDREIPLLSRDSSQNEARRTQDLELEDERRSSFAKQIVIEEFAKTIDNKPHIHGQQSDSDEEQKAEIKLNDDLSTPVAESKDEQAKSDAAKPSGIDKKDDSSGQQRAFVIRKFKPNIDRLHQNMKSSIQKSDAFKYMTPIITAKKPLFRIVTKPSIMESLSKNQIKKEFMVKGNTLKRAAFKTRKPGSHQEMRPEITKNIVPIKKPRKASFSNNFSKKHAKCLPLMINGTSMMRKSAVGKEFLGPQTAAINNKHKLFYSPQRQYKMKIYENVFGLKNTTNLKIDGNKLPKIN